MSEKRFLSFIFTESIILIVLSLCLLILPKITEFSFGFMLCLTLIVYGGYKVIMSFFSRNFEKHYILNLLNSSILLGIGILLLFSQIIDMIVVTSIIGVYFILASILSDIYAYQIKKIFSNWKIEVLLAIFQFLSGVILILFTPSLWFSGILIGLNFLLSGVTLLNLYLSKKYTE